MARHLLTEGCSVNEIARELRVSKSSVSLWVRDIPLSDEQRQALLKKSILFEGQWKGAAANGRADALDAWRIKRRADAARSTHRRITSAAACCFGRKATRLETTSA